MRAPLYFDQHEPTTVSRLGIGLAKRHGGNTGPGERNPRGRIGCDAGLSANAAPYSHRHDSISRTVEVRLRPLETRSISK